MASLSPSNSTLEIVVLAAGKGTRMRSKLPKVLHVLGDRPLLAHVIASCTALDTRAIHIVHGHGGAQVREAMDSLGIDNLCWAEQAEQLGTGHAVAQAMDAIAEDATVLVVYGDVPLIKPQTLMALVALADEEHVGLLTAHLQDGAGYGRIVRDEAGEVRRIVERKDASDAEIAIREINTGFVAARAEHLRRWLAALSNNNAQGEYYLTDIFAMAVSDGISIRTLGARDLDEIEGVNSKTELARLERALQRRIAGGLMIAGVGLRDPARIDVRGHLETGIDVHIDINAVFEGQVELGDGVTIGPNVTIRDSVIGEGTEILANSLIEDSVVGKDCRIGPFARLRPGANLGDHVHVGNFVEIKNAIIDNSSKINHLSYIGDTDMGTGVNIGAGTITANYDGANKHRTKIEDQASTGSNSVLVAPVTVGKGATLGAGTILRKDAPAGMLSLSDVRVRTIKGWKRPAKKQRGD